MSTRREILQGAAALALLAQVGGRTARAADAAKDSGYVQETDPQVLRKLATWQDWKFGLILHWGAYSQKGIVESWSICSEDEPWCARPDGASYVDYVRQYEQLPRTFDPAGFDPRAWAAAAHDAGMRYVVFTTKHHDGFCMFDTRQTDYRITAPVVPFHADARANVAKQVFDAFRARGFGIGAYFSKADWHHPDYWSPRWATPTRNNNYDTRKYPGVWKRFVDFTHAQVDELTTQYGRIDLMWLDAGWVNAQAHPEAKAYGMDVPWPQDINMPGIAKLARRNQPGIILVDRAVGGAYENYRTPEQTVPDKPLGYPWETCMTLGDSWSYKPDDKYKPAREIVHLLADIAAKGGNLLLGVGPDGNGQLPPTALAVMRDIGAWMQINANAIHGTRAVAPYTDGKLRFTRNADGSVNAIYLADAGEREPPAALVLKTLLPAAGAQVRWLGGGEPLAWRMRHGQAAVTLPASLRERLRDAPAWSLRISAVRD